MSHPLVTLLHMGSAGRNAYGHELNHELRSAVQILRHVVHTLQPESMTDEEALAVFNLLVEAKRISASTRARFAQASQLED